LAKYAAVPVINALSDGEHPCQALADIMTIYEKKGKLEGLTVAYIGDGNNVSNSLMLACVLVGMNFRIASPKGYELPDKMVRLGLRSSKKVGAEIALLKEPREAVKGADVVYTDVWTSMGQEAESERRREIFVPYQVNEALFNRAKPDAIFMHCLPAHRGEEVTDEVIDSRNSVVFDEAENRLHVQKAIMFALLRG
jgi:ornithine carbamoyltransferase